MKNGKGKQVEKNTGEIFIGQWKDGLKEGPGKLHRPQKNVIVDAVWH